MVISYKSHPRYCTVMQHSRSAPVFFFASFRLASRLANQQWPILPCNYGCIFNKAIHTTMHVMMNCPRPGNISPQYDMRLTKDDAFFFLDGRIVHLIRSPSGVIAVSRSSLSPLRRTGSVSLVIHPFKSVNAKRTLAYLCIHRFLFPWCFELLWRQLTIIKLNALRGPSLLLSVVL